MIIINENNNKLLCSVKISNVFGNIPLPETVGIIDTGCQVSMISIGKMCNGLVDSEVLKATDITYMRQGKVKIRKSVGVNDKRLNENIYLLSDNDLLRRKDIVFRHQLNDLSLNGVSLGSQEVSFSYDSDAPTLIGMNILKQFEWEYSNGLFTLYEKKSKGLDVFDSCIQKVKELLGAKLMLSEVKNTLKYDYSNDMINNALFVALKDTYYEGD